MAPRLTKTFVIFLFIYSAVFSFGLAYGAISKGIRGGDLVSIFLFFPVIFYFLREFAYQARVLTTWKDEQGRRLSSFRLRLFLTQRNGLLYLTFFLYSVALVLTYLRYQHLISTNISF